jgi:hypothetical protein
MKTLIKRFNSPIHRNRVWYGILVFLVILLGLGSRHYRQLLPGWVGLYAGDALWALMIFLGTGILFNKSTTGKVAGIALIFAYGIEISQLYHAPWIDVIRSTPLGGLVLGYGFLWSDLGIYLLGILLGALAELGITPGRGMQDL